MRLFKNDGTQVIKYSAEERERALDISLTSLASYLGYTPIRSGAHYHLKEMDSLIIYNDRTWNRWSGKGNITGGTTIDFMMAFGGASSVPDSIQRLVELSYSSERYVSTQQGQPPSDDKLGQDKKARDFKLPPKNPNYKRLYAYLMQTRGLSQAVISDFVHKRLIYEDAEHHNIVYCGMDPEGTIRYAGLRGTADIYGKKFKMDVSGNDKNYGVNIVNLESSTVKVFESVIDCMSYIDLTGDNESNKIVLGMVEDNPLAQFVKDYSHIKNIVFCLDNDEAGRAAIEGKILDNGNERIGLKEKYERLGYSVSAELPTQGKDFNEELLNKKKSSFKINQPIVEENAEKATVEQHIGQIRKGR